MKTIAVINRKGGVGKTSSAINIGAILAAQCDAKVLLIDLDPQGTMTLFCGIWSDPEISLYHVMREDAPVEKAIVTVENYCGIDLIPSGYDCDFLNKFLYFLEFEKKDSQIILKNILEKISDKYDYCIIDCPPARDALTTNALVASDYVMLPVEAADWALTAIPRMNKFILDIKGMYNPRLVNTGFFITRKIEKRKVQQECDQAFREGLNVKFYKQEIHEAAAVGNAIRNGRPLIKHNRVAQVTQDYIALTNELLKYMKEE